MNVLDSNVFLFQFRLNFIFEQSPEVLTSFLRAHVFNRPLNEYDLEYLIQFLNTYAIEMESNRRAWDTLAVHSIIMIVIIMIEMLESARSTSIRNFRISSTIFFFKNFVHQCDLIQFCLYPNSTCYSCACDFCIMFIAVVVDFIAAVL